MVPLLPLIAAGLVAPLMFVVRRLRFQGRMQLWRKAAAQAQLTDLGVRSELFRASLHGRSGELRVTLTSYRRGRYERGTRIQVDTGTRVSLRLEGVGTALGKRLVGLRELEIGDSAFDEACFIEGPTALVLGVLTPERRRALPTILRGYVPVGASSADVRVSFLNGVLQADVREHWFSPSFIVPELLKSMLEIARGLAPPPDLARRLADNFRSEPMPGVRLQLLLTLAREFPEHPATRELLRAACEDPSDEVALRAAIALGDEGSATLRALVGRRDAADSCRARAVSALGEQLAPAEAAARLRSALGSRQLLTAVACVERLARPDSTAEEPPLLQTLRDTDDRVRLAAVRALGAIGSVQAVAALRELSAAGTELRSAARQAIGEIHSRLTGAAPGQLSLAGVETGSLSFADDEGQGQLSLAEDTDSARPKTAEETAQRLKE
jgi:hypothetical protein